MYYPHLCLVSRRYDFPLLKAELQNAGCTLGDEDILVVDSLSALKEIDLHLQVTTLEHCSISLHFTLQVNIMAYQ